MKDLIRQLNESAEFQMIMKGVRKDRPVVPEYRVCGSKEECDLLSEQIKYASGMRAGWDALYRFLTGVAPDQ